MITGIHSATIMVRDQDKAVDFYTNSLGFETLVDNQYGEGMRFVVVAPHGTTYGIALIKPGDAGKTDADIAGFSGINLLTDDIQQTYKELSGKGVSFTQPPEQMPWGLWATWFNDPDGNTFFLSQEGQPS
ncbi:MAG: glyoxalase superfamily protein [Thermomicrobiales bacterium]